MMRELTGQKFGRWTPLEYVGASRWLCRCDCSAVKAVLSWSLTRGLSRSCGCLQPHPPRGMRLRHGHFIGQRQSRTYKSWSKMKERCFNPNNNRYYAYGARGITVCERWLVFDNFLEDMGERPEDRTLDRIDVDGNYEPENCRWATRSEQARNTRRRKAMQLGL
jgi:hypothetical protein